MYESDPGFYDLRRELQDADLMPWPLPDPRDPTLEERTRGSEPVIDGFSRYEERIVRALEEGDRTPHYS